MKNNYQERLRNRARLAHRNSDWDGGRGSVITMHVFEPTRLLSWWDDISFVLNNRRVMVWWVHPRMKYRDAIDDAAWKQVGDFPSHEAHLLSGEKIFKSAGKSRKRIVAYRSPTTPDALASHYEKLWAIKRQLQRDGIDHTVAPSMSITHLNWCTGVDLCVPVEIRCQADADALLTGITGVFISGGDQMRLTSILGGTNFAQKLREMVRETDLVLAGTSAGAAGMSASMIVRGEATSHPQKSSVRLSPGLGFLKNIIIDQHFTERGRMSRLITAVSYNPYNLGIGIDENTAIILDKQGILEVYGQGTVTIVDGSQISFNEIAEVDDNTPFAVCGSQIHILRDGLKYDYFERKLLPIENEFLLPDIR